MLGWMITTMTELHQAARDLAKIENEYAKLTARLAVLKAARRDKKRELRAAIVDAVTQWPAVTYVDLAAQFNVSEGTIRHIHNGRAADTQ